MSHLFEPMDTAVGRQCQSVAINTFNDRDVVAISMTSLTILGIICILVLYTLIAVLVGYHCSFRIVKNKRKTLMGKMTMTPVTYSAVRKVQHPRFEYSALMDGCWEFAG